MKRPRVINFISTVIVISLGITVLIGLTTEPTSSAASVATFFIELISVTAAVAVLVGLVNLLSVHIMRFVRVEHGWPYSVVMLLTALAVVVLRILDRAEIWPDDLEGRSVSGTAFEAIQVSLEAALAALLLFFLVYAAYRLMRRQVTLWSFIFSAVVVVLLVSWAPLEGADALRDIYDWVLRVPVSAGARGILIGVGLGTVTVGVRVLMGQDRSFRS